MEWIPDDIDASVIRFMEAAREYCSWVEATPREPREELLHVRKLLANLYCAALDLPDVAPDEAAESQADPPLSDPRLAQRFRHLPFDYYWSSLEPLDDKSSPAGGGLLSDDLGSIYEDLVEGLVLYHQGERNTAIWTWRFGFETHWGKHVVDSLGVIHWYVTTY